MNVVLREDGSAMKKKVICRQSNQSVGSLVLCSVAKHSQNEVSPRVVHYKSRLEAQDFCTIVHSLVAVVSEISSKVHVDACASKRVSLHDKISAQLLSDQQ